MVNRSLSIELSLWKQAQRKAGLLPISAVIRRLLQLWIAGKIRLEDYNDEEN